VTKISWYKFFGAKFSKRVRASGKKGRRRAGVLHPASRGKDLLVQPIQNSVPKLHLFDSVTKLHEFDKE